MLENIKEWINHSLGGAETRISINDFEEDLKDGMVIKSLLEKHCGKKLTLPCGDFVQSKERQLLNLKFLIDHVR